METEPGGSVPFLFRRYKPCRSTRRESGKTRRQSVVIVGLKRTHTHSYLPGSAFSFSQLNMALLSSLLSKRAVQSSLYRQGFGNNVPAFRMVSAASSPQSPPPPSANPNPMHPDDLYQKRDEHFNKLSARYAYKESPYALGKHRSNALDLVMKVPPIEVDGDMAICDGGGGALGHPIEYIALDKPGKIGVCKYCSLRFIKKAH